MAEQEVETQEIESQYDFLFGVPVGRFKPDVDLNSLIEFSYSCQKDDPKGRAKSNEGGWQSREIQHEPHAEIQKLVEELERCSQEMHMELGFREKLSQKVSAMWININEKGDRNILHFHDRSIFSGVFYLKIKAKHDEGSLSLRSPNYMTIMSQWISKNIVEDFNFANSGGWQMWMPAGNLLIFPSWLEHEVMPHNNDEDRISISFNTWIPKDITGPDNIAWSRPLNTSIN